MPTSATETAGWLRTHAIASCASDLPERAASSASRWPSRSSRANCSGRKKRQSEGDTPAPPIARFEGMVRGERPGQQAETKGAVRHESHVVLKTVGQHAALHPPVQQVIPHLIHRNIRDLQQ